MTRNIQRNKNKNYSRFLLENIERRKTMEEYLENTVLKTCQPITLY